MVLWLMSQAFLLGNVLLTLCASQKAEAGPCSQRLPESQCEHSHCGLVASSPHAA